MNLNIVFESWFIGPQYSFIAVSDDISHAQPVQVGTWTAYAADATLPLPVVPSGVSAGGIITMNYQETPHNQFGYVTAMYVEFGQSFDSTANCRFIYQRGTGVQNHTVTLFGSGWDQFVDQGAVGVPGVPMESPGRCKIDLSRSNVGENGIYGALNLALTLYNADPTNKITVWEFPIDRANTTNNNWRTATFSTAAQTISLTNDSADTVALQVGQSTSYNVSLGSIGNFAGSVAVTCTGSGGLTCVGSTVNVPANNSVNATITVTAPSSALTGNQTVTVSAATNGPHTLGRTFKITAAPIPPSVIFSANQAQSIPYGTDAYYTVTVTGNSTWPAGRQVKLTTVIETNAVGASFWDGVPGIGGVNSSETVSVPGSALYRMFAPYPGAQSYSARIQASDSITGTPLTTTDLYLSTATASVPGPSLSVISSVTIPAGGSVTTPVGLSVPVTYSGALTLSSSPGISFVNNDSTVSPSKLVLAKITARSGSSNGTSYSETISAPGIASATIAVTISSSDSPPSSTDCGNTRHIGFRSLIFQDGGQAIAQSQAQTTDSGNYGGWKNQTGNIRVSTNGQVVASNSDSSDQSTDSVVTAIQSPAFNLAAGGSYTITADYTFSNDSCTTAIADPGGVISPDQHTVTYSDISTTYTINSVPVITSLQLSGPLVPGGSVVNGVVTGSNFGMYQTGQSVFNICDPGASSCSNTPNIGFQVTSWLPSKIIFIVAASASARGSYDVQVTTGGGGGLGITVNDNGDQIPATSNHFPIVTSKDPVLQLTYTDANGTSHPISPGNCSSGGPVLINTMPQMPAMYARLAAGQQALSGNVTWKLNISFPY